MKIAIIGSRGIPAKYGGFETFAERLAIGLVRKGHSVTVYGLLNEERDNEFVLYKGVKCYNFRAPQGISLQKPVLAIKSVIHCLGERPDLVLLLGVSAAPFSFLCRLAGMKTIINLDGLEWKRQKWGRLGRWYLRLSEWIAIKSCNIVIADSKSLIGIYKDLYGIESVYIPYGADVPESVPFDSLERYGLKLGEYILQSCRLEPENNVHLVIEAYLRSKMSLPLVILGDAPSGSKYKEMLLKMAGDKVRFLGFVFGPDYQQIVAHAGLYIHAHEVGGTNPSLLEAMAVGQAPLYLDVPFNREVCEEIGFPFQKDPDELSRLIDELSENRGYI
ncbi:MAG: DUF1972 domain-containing protein, partial [Thermoplasmata archaeon]